MLYMNNIDKFLKSLFARRSIRLFDSFRLLHFMKRYNYISGQEYIS